MKTTKQQQALLNAMTNGKLDSQNQQNLIFKILNNSGNDELKELIKSYFNADGFEGFDLSSPQVRKGFDWLWNKYLTPLGAERKNNPFGYREQDALKNFEDIKLKGFYDAGNSFRSFYVPLYDVYAKDGYGFEYFVWGGTCHIIG